MDRAIAYRQNRTARSIPLNQSVSSGVLTVTGFSIKEKVKAGEIVGLNLYQTLRGLMKLAKFVTAEDPTPRLGLIEGDSVRVLSSRPGALTEVLHSVDVSSAIRALSEGASETLPLAGVHLLAPLDAQEVWGAGVTYERSKVARQEESEQGGSFYDLVYRAPRPEIFFKATPSRVVGPGGAVRVRRDSKWSVPEPELALVLSDKLELVGFTVGNDMSARDIEGQNPLDLPQAKTHEGCCALGPCITLADAMPAPAEMTITVRIERNGAVVFEGATSVARMARSFKELIGWLGIDNVFPTGVILLTGTGIVPPDEVALQDGDHVEITIEGIGSLENSVVQAASAS